jgi:hypothetical protein
MATVDLLAGEVMNQAASLMNDTARTVYTYAKQVPYLNMALQELQEWFEQHNLSVTQRVTSPVITIPAATQEIIFNGGGVPTLPDNLIEPLQLWESITGQSQYIPMTKRDFLPHDFEGVPTNYLVYWVWENQKVRFLPSTSVIDVKIDYMAEIFTAVTNENSAINVMNAKTFLEYRTAGLMAEFIERNMSSAQGMNAYSELALNRVTSIGSKSKQRIQTRRRPFRASYKKRGWMT